MASRPPSTFMRRIVLPTLLVGLGTWGGFWLQGKLIDQYKADQLRQIQTAIDAEELAEARARMDPHQPKGMPKEVLDQQAAAAKTTK